MPMNNKEPTVILITSEIYTVEYWYLQTTFGTCFDKWVIIRASNSFIFLWKTEIDLYQWPQINKTGCYKFVNTPVHAININFHPVHFKFVFLEDVVFSVCQPM